MGVEGQNYIRGDVLANRQLLYSSRMITEQEKGTTKQQLYENMNLFVGALFLVVIVCLLVKRAMDRRGGED